VTRVNDSTRLESWFVVTRTRLESRWEKWWPKTRVRVLFTISLSSWWTNSVRLHTKKWAFYASVMINIGANFLFCLFSCAMLHFKDQVSPPCVEVDLRLCFHWEVGRAQYIGTLSWFNVVLAYRDHGSGPHTVTLSLFQKPVKWLKLSGLKSKQKTILQNKCKCEDRILFKSKFLPMLLAEPQVATW